MASKIAIIAVLSLILMLSASCKLTTDPKQPTPIVCLTFDDQHGNVYRKALPVMQQYGFRGSCFVNSGRIGQNGNLTLAEISSLHSQYKWEIGGHSLNHENLTQLSYPEAEQAITEDYNNLVAWGLTPQTFAIPSGNSPLEYYSIIQNYYHNIRGSSDFGMFKPLNKLSLGYFPFQSDWNAAIVKERIRRGIVNNESLIVIGFHRIDADTEAYGANCPINIFQEIISYIDQQKLEVLPLAEAVDKLSK